MTAGPPLRVLIDGAPLPDAAARDFWARFSAWMEDHKGDLGGFASAEGLASVQPQMHPGGAVLVGSRSAPQGPYENAKNLRDGSPARPQGRQGRPGK